MVLIVVAALANLGDALTTTAMNLRGGLELVPESKYVISNFGIGGYDLLKVGISVLLILLARLAWLRWARVRPPLKLLYFVIAFGYASAYVYAIVFNSAQILWP